MRAGRVAVILLVLTSTGCPFGAVLPPSRTEVGHAFTTVDGAVAPNLHFKTGAHIAGGSLNPNFPIDIGVGYLLESVPQREGPPARQWVQGGYLETTIPLRPMGKHMRGFAGARGELLFDQVGGRVDGRASPRTRYGVGFAARVGVEWFTVGEGAQPFRDRCAAGVVYARGATGLGFFVEGGHQWLPDGRSAMLAVAGISLRLPLVMGGGLAIPYCR